MEDVCGILKEVFGDENPSRWERASDEIKGLWVCSEFLSPEQQSLLFQQIEEEGWFSGSCNQAMRFGDLPGWALELSASISQDILLTNLEPPDSLFPSHLLWRRPLFDQLIVNKYEPGQGIRSHVDLMSFEDGIAIISLESSCIMHFSQVPMDEQDCAANQETFNTRKVPLYLTPGSLVLMWGEACYLWEHGIDRTAGVQMWEGQEIKQKRRISITLRRLCQNFTP